MCQHIFKMPLLLANIHDMPENYDDGNLSWLIRGDYVGF